MKHFIKVRGSQETVPTLEVNIDTVYVRSNIVRIETEEFTGWEYDEIQYGIREYIEVVGAENLELQTSQVETNMLVLELMELQVNQTRK